MRLLERAEKAVISAQNALARVGKSERGGLAGYGIAWLFGVPVSVLVIVYLIKHH